MFAKVAKPQTKAGEVSASRPTPLGSTLGGDRLGCDPVGQEVAPENATAREAPSWDFGKLPLFPPDRAYRPQPSSPLATTPLPGIIQAKLAVGRVNDPLEHEADRVADHVMRMPDPSFPISSVSPQISRKCAACEEEAQLLQAKAARSSDAPVLGKPDIVQDVLRTPGQPLDAESRDFFESRFGSNFSQVRIHADTRAAESARAVNARAYTVGQHVVFGHDRYAPRTADGRHLLAHELTHTLQQRGGAARLQRQPDPPGSSPPPARPDLETRLKIIDETGHATRARLDEIIRTGGPMPNTKDGAKVVGAAIIDVEGYQGPTEMRAINGLDGDALGRGAPVYHATTPTTRTLTETKGAPTERGGREASIRGPRRESIYSHANDAEIKIFEDIISRLPRGAKGTIYFTTVRIAKGQTAIEPYPACSGCIRASFEAAGITGIDLVSHAPAQPPMATGNLGESHEGAGEPEKPPAQAGKTPVKPVAPGDPASGEAAQVKGQGGGKAPAGTNVEPGGAGKSGGTAPAQKTTGTPSQSGGAGGLAIQVGAGVATLGLEWLASYLRMKVDQNIAQRQIDAFKAVAKTKINANPDEAVKKMMADPYRTV